MRDVLRGDMVPSGSLERSRELAAGRLVGGSGVLLTGLAAAGAAFLFPTTLAGGWAAIGLFAGGLTLAGLGGARMSLSASHLWRFGERRSLWVPLAAGGLGVSAGMVGLSVLGGLSGALPGLGGLFIPGLTGVLGFGVLLAVLTVSALLRWMRER